MELCSVLLLWSESLLELFGFVLVSHFQHFWVLVLRIWDHRQGPLLLTESQHHFEWWVLSLYLPDFHHLTFPVGNQPIWQFQQNPLTLDAIIKDFQCLNVGTSQLLRKSANSLSSQVSLELIFGHACSLSLRDFPIMNGSPKSFSNSFQAESYAVSAPNRINTYMAFFAVPFTFCHPCGCYFDT